MADPRCVFCDSPGPFSKEDVWPKWVRKLLIPRGPVKLFPGHNTRHIRTDGHLRHVARRAVCKTCNNVWLSQLESAAKPLLADAILNRGPVTWSPAERDVVQRWAVLKAWTLHLASVESIRGTPPMKVPAGHLKWLANNAGPIPGTCVYAFRFDHRGQYAANHHTTPIYERGATEPCGALVTFSLASCGFQVIGTSLHRGERGATEPVQPEPATPPRQYWPYLAPVCSHHGPPVGWPPLETVSFEFLPELARWGKPSIGAFGTIR